MKFYKHINGGFLTAVEKRESASSGSEISEQEYNQICEIIRNKPVTPEGKDYRLTDALEWELYDLPPAPPLEEDPDEIMRQKAEAYDILMGGGE